MSIARINYSSRQRDLGKLAHKIKRWLIARDNVYKDWYDVPSFVDRNVQKFGNKLSKE